MRERVSTELRRLWVRLALAFLLVTWGALGAVALVVRQATDANFRTYLNQQEITRFDETALARLVDYYAAQGSWAGADDLLRQAQVRARVRAAEPDTPGRMIRPPEQGPARAVARARGTARGAAARRPSWRMRTGSSWRPAMRPESAISWTRACSPVRCP